MALMQTLKDDFATGSLDAAKWTGSYGTVTVTSGQLNMSTLANQSYYSGFNSVASYDLSGSFLLVEVVNAGNQALPSLENYPCQLVKDASNKLSWYINNGSISAIKTIAAVGTLNGTTSYSSTTHRWLRIRESGGTTFWDYSANGKTWTTLYSVANPFALTVLTADPAFGNYGTTEAASTTIWDNINYPTPVGRSFNYRQAVNRAGSY